MSNERETCAYEVRVETTNGAQDTFGKDGWYRSCKDGIVIVTTDTPGLIFEQWGKIVISVKKIGPAIEMS